VYTHPLEVHEEHFTQGDIRIDAVVLVHLFMPAFGPGGEISCLVVEGVGMLVFLDLGFRLRKGSG